MWIGNVWHLFVSHSATELENHSAAKIKQSSTCVLCKARLLHPLSAPYYAWLIYITILFLQNFRHSLPENVPQRAGKCETRVKLFSHRKNISTVSYQQVWNIAEAKEKKKNLFRRNKMTKKAMESIKLKGVVCFYWSCNHAGIGWEAADTKLLEGD